MPGKLISLDKRGQERDIFPVVNLHVFIGSDPYCDLRIKHKSILPQHCLITAQKDKPALIRSLSHASPTLVNGTEIGTKDIELKDNDVITISHKQYKWQYDEISKTPDGNFNSSTKGRKSWPLFKNKLVAVVTPHRRDEDKDLPLKKRRATFGGDKLNTSSKKGKVLGIKSGVKGSRKSTATKKSSIKISPTTAKLSLSQVPLTSRKSVKFADTVFQRQLGRRRKMSYGPSTPHRANSTPGGGKASLYFTPPSSSGGKKPKKGILKTPVSHSKGLYSSRLSDLGKGTPPGVPETSQNLDQIEEEESGLRTPPKEMSEQPEIIMRSSKRSVSRPLLSPESTPKSASKSKERRVNDDESLEASERAAKKLKQNPPVAIDKKKMAALLQCHRKSLTPHPVVYGRGRTLLATSSSKPVVKPTSTSPNTPTSIKKRGRPKKSDLTPYSKVVPKVLRFGSLGNSEGAQQKKKRKPPFQPRSLDRKYPTSRGSVAKMISSPSPPGKKMTRATRAARASREPVHKREVTDVLSALDLSRKWPAQQESAETSRKPTSPIADFTNVSGIKELFSTDKTVDVRELFLEESNRQSRRSSKSSETSESSNNLDGVELRPSSPLSHSSQLTASTSRRSLTLKGSRTPLASPRLLNEVKKSPFNKRSFSISNQSISTLESQEFEDAEESDFSLGSFNSSKYKSRDTSLSLSPASTSQPTLGHSIANKVSRMLSNTNPMSVVKKIKKQRLSLRRMVLSSSTPKALSTSLPDVIVTEEVPVVIDLTRDSPERSLPLKKRSLKAVTNDIQNSVDSSIVIDVDDEPVISKHSISLPSEGDSSSKRVGRPPKKSKTQTANLSYDTDSQKSDTSNLTDVSLKVNIGSIRKNLSDNSLVSFITPAKDKLSKSVVIGNKPLPNAPSRRSSAPGKVTKVRTKSIVDRSTLLKSKSTRSTSSVNIDLFGLDKLPRNLPSSTPLKVNKTKNPSEELNISVVSPHIKSTRNKSEVNINLFRLDEEARNSRVNKSLNIEKVINRLKLKGNLSKSFPPHKANDDFLQINTSQLSKSGNSTLNKSHISQKNMSSSNILEKSNKSITTSKIYNTSRSKSTRSTSSVTIDLFKLDDKPLDFESSRSLKYSPFNVSVNSVPEKIRDPKDISKPNVSALSRKGRSLMSSPEVARKRRSVLPSETSKSTRSRSSVNIDLFKLDDKRRDSVKEKSFRSKSAEGILKKSVGSLSSPKPKDHILERSPRDISSSSVECQLSTNLEAKKATLIKGSGKNNTDSTLETSSIQNKSTRRQTISEKTHDSNSTNALREKSFRNKSEKSILNISVSSVNDRKSLSPIKRLGNDRSQIADTTLGTTPKQKSTRSASSVNIDLFKLDDKPRGSVSKSTLKDKSFRSKSAEGKLDKSLEHSVSSPKLSNSKSEKSILNISVSSVNDRKSLSPKKRMGNDRSQIADTTLGTTPKQKSTRSASSVNIDLFKLDEKPRGSVSKSTLKDKSFRSKSAEGKLDKSLEHQVSSPKLSNSKSEESILNTSVSSVKDRKSRSPNKRMGNDRSQIADTTLGTTPKQKSTRSASSVNIDLFKLDDKPRGSVSKSTLKDKSFRSKSAEGKLDKSHEHSVSSPKLSNSKLEKSILNISVSSVKDRKSLSPNKRMGNDRSQIADTTLGTTPKQKSTRSASSVNIDLFKLDDKPRGSVSKSTLKDKSFRSKSAEGKLDKSHEHSVSSPKLSNSKLEKSILNISVSSVKDRKSLSPNKRMGNDRSQIADTTLGTTPKQKSTRSASSVNIDLFKLDEKPRGSVSKSTLKDKSFRSKSAEGNPEINFRVSTGSKLEKSSNNIKVSSVKSSPLATIGTVNHKSQIADSDEPSSAKNKSTRSRSSVNVDLFKLDNKSQVSRIKSPLKKVAFGGLSESKTTEYVLSPNSQKRSMEKTLSDSSISVKRHSRGSSVGGSPRIERINKSERKILKESKLLDKIEDRPTRRSSSVNIDLFKLDDKSSISTTPTSNKRKRSIVEGNLDDSSFSIGKVLPVASTPAVAGKKLKKSLSEISPITNLNTPAKPSKSTVISNISELNKSKQIHVLSRKSSLEKSLSGNWKKLNIGLDDLCQLNESPLKRNRKSSLTPSLNSLTLSSSVSKWKRSEKSPRVILSALSASQIESFKSSPTKTYDYKQTQTSTVKKTIKTPYAKQLDLLHKIPIVNFANEATPVDQFRARNVISTKSRHSSRQKDIDEAHRTPEYSTNDKTPLSALFPIGRHSLSKQQTPVNKSKNSKQSPLSDRNQISLSFSEISPSSAKRDSKKQSIKSPVTPRSQTVNNNQNKNLVVGNKSANLDKSVKDGSKKMKQANRKIHLKQGRDVSIPIQDYAVGSTMNVTPQRKLLNNPLEISEVSSSSTNSKKSITKIKQKTVNKKIDSCKADEKLTTKSNSVKSPRVVALKVSKLKDNKVLSSPIIKGSPPIRRTRNKLQSETKKITPPVREEKKSKGKLIAKTRKLSIGYYKDKFYSPNVEISSKRSTRNNKVTGNATVPVTKKSTKKISSTEKNTKKNKQGKLNDVSHEIVNKLNEPKFTKGKLPKLVVLKVEKRKVKKILSSSIIKTSPVKGRRTRANKLQISNVSQNGSPSVQEEKNKGKTAGKSSREIKGKQVLVKSPKADISTKRQTRRNQVTVKSPETKKSAKSSPTTGKKKIEKLPSLIAKEAVKPISRAHRNTINDKSTPIEQPTTSKAKAVKSLQPLTVQESKINSPVITKIGKRGRGAKSPVKEEKSVEHEQPPRGSKLTAKRGRPKKIDKPLIIFPIVHVRRLENVKISPLQMKVEKTKMSPSKISSPAVRRGRTAKSKVSDSNKSKAKESSSLKIKSSSKKKDTKQKPNLKTVMKATKSNSSTKIKKIIKLSAASLNEITKGKSLPQKGKATKRTSVEEKKSIKSLDTLVKDQGSPVAKRGRPAKSSGKQDKPLTPVVKLGRPAKSSGKQDKPLTPVVKLGRPAKSSGKQDKPLTPVIKLGRRAKPIEKGKATKRKSPVEEKKSTKSLVTSVKEQESPVAKRGRPAKSSGKKDKPLTPVVKLGRRAKPIEKRKATTKTQKK